MEADMIPTSSRHRAALALVFGVSIAALAGAPAVAATLKVPMTLATPQGPGASVGTVTLSDGAKGVSLAADLHGLPPGQHGFHLHANPSCAPSTAADGKVTAAGAAGAHLDPDHTNMHMGPEGAGHLGDLPRLDVAADGSAHDTVTAPRIKSVAEFKGHALMIHAGGDDYSDTPPLGGGGARIACGVVP
jgi:Cu-Zn family superoxide dismutase